MRKIYQFFFRFSGWTVSGELPKEYKKYILIVAPHTSNWDFLIGIGVRAVLDFFPRYVGKKALFVWPIGGLFKKLGGYPVERSKSTNFVQSIVDIFNKEEAFILTITPEGTRDFNDQWKTGFYFIAKQANIPIVPVAFDYKTKTVVISEPIFPIKPVDEMVIDLKKWFSKFEGKIKEYGVRFPTE